MTVAGTVLWNLIEGLMPDYIPLAGSIMINGFTSAYEWRRFYAESYGVQIFWNQENISGVW